ncbi:MAG TPA: hypothetical protein VE619_06020 [Nitrososphaeraceae archaeon]|nr:hypothetical protein [Nitrososphaeraceae archaeon]
MSNYLLIEEFNEISCGVQSVFVSNLSHAKKLPVTNIVLEILKGEYLRFFLHLVNKILSIFLVVTADK